MVKWFLEWVEADGIFAIPTGLNIHLIKDNSNQIFNAGTSAYSFFCTISLLSCLGEAAET